jgi:Fe-S cluster assembly scaffold protein SufB
MAKTAKKRRIGSRAATSKKRSNTRKPDKNANPQQVRSETKQSNAIEMLRAPAGASIQALIKATGWQQHSVRGFLAGVVRKRLKLNLESALEDGVRIYRVADGPAGASLKTQSTRTKS